MKGTKVLRIKRSERGMQTNSVRWREIREIQLSKFPYCEDCEEEGITKFATEVDHRDGDATNDDPSNYQSLCKPHHSRKTRLETIGDRHGKHGEANPR